MEVLVIGGGASGLVAAIKASEKHHVTIMEANDKCGKKLLLTGNGRCNYWHEGLYKEKYVTDDYSLLDKILFYDKETFDYLFSLGIYPCNKDGYIYPRSKDSNSVHTILVNNLKNIDVLYNNKCQNIEQNGNGFNIYTNTKKYYFDKVIVATGGASYPKTGSDGSIYGCLKKLGHSCTRLLPGLCFLKSNDPVFNKINGVRSDAVASLYINGNLVKEERGEIQFTSDGLSGICIFNLSLLASPALDRNDDVKIKLNLMPNDSFENIMTRTHGTVENVLESLLNYKLIDVILKRSHISKDAYYKSLTESEKKALEENLYNLSFSISEPGDINKSQVTLGGIPLSEVNSNLESKIVKGLYLIGEVLNVAGECGGYNLAFAFISGYCAGRDI